MLMTNGSPSRRATACTPGTFRRLGTCSVSYTSLNNASLSGSTSMLATNRYLALIGIETFPCCGSCPLELAGRASPNIQRLAIRYAGTQGVLEKLPPAVWTCFVASGCGGGIEEWVIKQGRNFGRRDGLTEQVALRLCASIGLETCQLLSVLDAFGCRRQTESLCKSEDGADNHQAVGAFVEKRHETPIDLDFVEMK